jgi:hypothetical protein
MFSAFLHERSFWGFAASLLLTRCVSRGKTHNHSGKGYFLPFAHELCNELTSSSNQT